MASLAAFPKPKLFTLLSTFLCNFASPNNGKNAMRWSEGCLTFSVGWEGPSCETEAFPERTSVMSKKITTTTPPTGKYNKEQGWDKNTELCVNMKTMLRSDVRMKVGKDYHELQADAEAGREPECGQLRLRGVSRTPSGAHRPGRGRVSLKHSVPVPIVPVKNRGTNIPSIILITN